MSKSRVERNGRERVEHRRIENRENTMRRRKKKKTEKSMRIEDERGKFNRSSNTPKSIKTPETGNTKHRRCRLRKLTRDGTENFRPFKLKINWMERGRDRVNHQEGETSKLLHFSILTKDEDEDRNFSSKEGKSRKIERKINWKWLSATRKWKRRKKGGKCSKCN